ncbi:MAG: ArsA family ATPase [Candidatus Lokiarchaeota archaeon]|nr:ArsA family ATPase [Candidatus Lokiarchaeota archaeon]
MGIRLPFSAELDKGLDWKALLMPKIVIFSGKGGVGKTTITAALASARARLGRRIIVVSVDPAHSLGDSLCMDLSDGLIHPVPGFSAMLAQEPRIASVGASAEGNGSVRDGGDDPESVQRLLGDIFLPASEELTVIQDIIRTWRMLREMRATVDEIYIDGSPSGHMLRSLRFPFRMNEYLGKLGNFLGGIKRILVYDAKKREDLKKRAMVAESFKTFMDILSNPALATTVLVTIPETMALAETERTYEALEAIGIHVTNLVVNKIRDPGSIEGMACPFCAERARNEATVLQQINDSLGSKDITITRVPLLDHEIRGTDALVEMGNFLLDPGRSRDCHSARTAT